MKKIISLLAALAMMVSVSATAFAVVPVDAAPKGIVALTDLGEADDTFHIYELKVNLVDVGTLTFNKDAGAGKKYSGTKIAQFDFKIVGADIYTDSKKGSLGTTGWSGTGDCTEDSNGFFGILASYLETDPELNYPQTVGSTTNKCDGAIVIEFYGIPGAEINLASGNLGYLTYSVSGMSNINDGFKYAPVSFDTASFTLPGGAEVKELEMTVDCEGKFDNGYVWTAEITQGDEGEVDSLTAEFVSGGQTANRGVVNIGDLTSKFGGAGSLRFNIGLVTTKILDSATFTVTDNAGGIVVVPAALN